MNFQIEFSIEYFTQWGQNLYISGNCRELGQGRPGSAVKMNCLINGSWTLTIKFSKKPENNIRYRYFLIDENNGSQFPEWGEARKLDLSEVQHSHVFIRDFWRPHKNFENVFFTSAFTRNLMHRNGKKSGEVQQKFFNYRFQLYAPRNSKDLYFCLCGSDPGLGKWDVEKAIVMDDSEYPLWKADVLLESDAGRVEFKYGIYDKEENKLISWENGENRVIDNEQSLFDNYLTIRTDQNYRYAQGRWNGSGIAVPVFAVRSRNSWGVGEFRDLKLLIDWAVKTGMKIVQILPVNDTIASHTWMDSYPYAAISVYALHPLYLHCPEIGELESPEEMEEFRKKGSDLNQYPEVDYLEVMKLKSKFYKKIYDQNRVEFLSDPEFKAFFEANKHWLIPYAAFSCLRDRFGTSDFSQWGQYAQYDAQEIAKLVRPGGQDFDDVAVHYFIQYHLHIQLSEIAAYARKKGVIFKGDIPIGIFRNSVDAWINPHLYHMDKQAGAPPDAYSISGQNWKFPTYNWQEMAKDNYSWWRSRLTHMARYFDAYRLDHILGFFRIWEIPLDSVEGLMGKFNPAIPMYRHELESRGLYFDYERFCRPYIREYMLDEIFGEYKQEVKEKHLENTGGDRYRIKEDSDTQKKIEEIYSISADEDADTIRKKEKIKFGMFQLIGNILFFEEPGSNGNAFHPKIAFHQTFSYRELDGNTKNILNDIYTHYFYHRQEDYWREQAMVKLPAILSASNMFVCGEDLGMVPDCVPGVMEDLNILRLYIQRMPKMSGVEFGHPSNAPYLSVSSPSCHDMSTIRGWWEEDYYRSQRYYNQILGHHGEAPAKCESWIAEEIVLQHLYSPSMWSIFPIQDLFAMDNSLRRKKVNEERINDPSNPRNLWKYRMHIYLEDLINNENFNNRLLDMVLVSGRKNSI